MSNNRELGYVVGAVAGYFTGGLSYVALGATVGGVVGGLLDGPTQTQGPRLDDLKVQYSSYGVGIPRLYGTYRVSPNVIWSTNKLEKSRTDSQGKGGGTENTTFAYYVQMRLLLCETPPDGSDVEIVQIFKDGKLIFDARSGIPADSALASVENPFAFFTLYQGKPDQLPDPVEEIYESGPGSVPAYRGVVSISMKAIECPGGRVPQFSFVLSNNASHEARQDLLNPRPYPGDAWFSGSSYGSYAYDIAEEGGNSGIQRVLKVSLIESGSATLITERPIGFTSNEDAGFIGLHGSAEPRAIRALYNIDNVHRDIEYLELASGTIGLGPSLVRSAPLAHAYYDENTGETALVFQRTDKTANLDITLLGNEDVTGITIPPDSAENVVIRDGVLSTLTNHDGATWFARWDLAAGTMIDELEGPRLMDLQNGPFSTAVLNLVPMYAAGEGVYVLDSDDQKIYLVNETWELLSDLSNDAQINVEFGGFWADRNHAIIGSWPDGYRFLQYRTVEPTSTRVSEVIADQCERSGEIRYDVSAIPDDDTVIGYVVSNPASARANIDPLLTAFQIFIVDEDGLIRFKKYKDIESVAEISHDELGQAEDGAEASDAMPLNRAQEIDLPRTVSVSYTEPLNDYQTATETEVRQVTEATEDVLVSLPMAISSNQAKKAAANILFSLHRRQNTRSLKVSRKFAFLSPGDGVTVEYPRGINKLWRWTNITDTGALIEGTVELGDAQLYSQVAVGATGYVGQVVEGLPPASILGLFDMPILRDADSSAGKYAAIRPSSATTWKGANLFVSDDDLNYEDQGSVTRAAVMGVAESVLEDGPFGEIDHASELIVNVGPGELSTTTWASLFASSTNLAALQTRLETPGFPDARVEIFQFRVATSLGDGRYRLTEMVRGLFGTEQVSFNHQIGDKFLLLSNNGILRVNFETGAIGSSKFYKAVSAGRNLSSVQSVRESTVGYGLRPLSPIRVRLDRSAADGSILFAWDRRTRFSHRQLSSIRPLGEVSEVYEIVVYTDDDYATVKSVYRVYTATFNYSAASIAGDGFTQSGDIPYRIYQISDAVGRGVPFQPGQGIQ